jgi:hypothetical protein
MSEDNEYSDLHTNISPHQSCLVMTEMRGKFGRGLEIKISNH